MDPSKIYNKDIKEERTPGCYIAAIRANMSVAVVAMVNSSPTEGVTSNNSCHPTDQSKNIANSSDNPVQNRTQQNGEFDWNSNQQGLLLGSYYYGYIISNIPGAYLVQRCGIRYVLGIVMLLSSLLTLLAPLFANWSFVSLVVSRILLGIFQGVTMPAMFCAWGKWAPPTERSTMVSLQMSGMSVGPFVTLPLSAFLADIFGWEAIFYVTGGLTLLWSLSWIALIHNSPAEHPRISEQERQYIVSSINGQNKRISESRTGSTPWKEILTSGPVWGIIVSHYAYNYGDYFFLAMLPTYMATVHGFDLLSSGTFSALPFLLQTITTVIAAYATDVIIKRKILTTTAVRKGNNTLGQVLPAILIITTGHVGCNSTTAIILLTAVVAVSGLNVSGSQANAVDIAPAFAAPIYGISNTIANLSGFLAPQISGIILLNNNSIAQWQIVFLVTAITYSIGALTYLLLASAVEQRWASGKSASEVEDKELLPNNQFTPLALNV